MSDRTLAFRNRRAEFSFIAYAVVFGLLCVAAWQTRSFHLRIVCEAFAAASLVLLTVWIWFSRSGLAKRLVVGGIGVIAVVLGCRLVLHDGFASWLEIALWYVPVTCVLSGVLQLAGYAIEETDVKRNVHSFSIRSMMLATGVVAVLFPLTGNLIRSRARGRLDTILWLTDALVLVVPTAFLVVAIVCAVLSDKLFHLGVLLIAAPIIGILICRIWGWDHYQQIVFLMSAVAVVATVIALLTRRQGFRLVKTFGRA